MEKFTCILLITMFLLSSLASESCAYSTATSKTSSGFHRVELALYYDTLCPFSAKFIAEKLPDVFNKGLNSIVDLQLVPWGNAVLESNGTIMTCQHGDDECRLNAAEACVIELWPEVEDHFKHIKCIEQKLLDRKGFQSCFSKAEGKAINHCFVTIAEQLLLKHKAKTDSLKPPHTFVPWVVVNDQPLQDDYENYIKYVCKAYKGPPPEACKSVPLQVMNVAKGITRGLVNRWLMLVLKISSLLLLLLRETTQALLLVMGDRNWADLQNDCLIHIFARVKTVTLVESVQFVCKSWFHATLDPLCWKILTFPDRVPLQFVKLAVLRSQILATDVVIEGSFSLECFIYLYDQCPQLEHLNDFK